MSALGNQTASSSILNNHVVIHASAGQQVVQLKKINSEELERLHAYYQCIPAHQTPPTLSITMGLAKTDVNTIFQMADTNQVPELATNDYTGWKWLEEWSFDKLYLILKKCLNLMTTAADVNSIKTTLDNEVLSSTADNWHNSMTFVNYKGRVYTALKDNSVMNRETDEMNKVLKDNEKKLLANSLFDNLPTSNEMEKAFKNVVKAASLQSKGKFDSIPLYFETTAESVYKTTEITTVRMVRNVKTKLMQNYLQISMHQTNDVMVVDTSAYARVRSRVSIDYILDTIKKVRHGLYQRMVKLMRTKT